MNSRPPRDKAFSTGDHQISDELEAFFSQVSNDLDLQKRLYNTVAIADVAQIAMDIGFKVSAGEILRAQAARILQLSPLEQKTIAAGKKPETGAQWGRDGKSYLDDTGAWVLQILRWNEGGQSTNGQIAGFYAQLGSDKDLQQSIRTDETHDAVSALAAVSGYKFSGQELLQYHAWLVLKMLDNRVDAMARNLREAD